MITVKAVTGRPPHVSRRTVWVEDRKWTQLKRLAKLQETTISRLIRHLIEAEIARHAEVEPQRESA